MFAGKHPPGAPEACSHFVGDQQDTAVAAPLLKRLEKTAGHHDHAGSALDQGFDNKAGNVVGVDSQNVVEHRQAVCGAVIGRAIEAVRVRVRHFESGKEQVAVGRMEQVHAASADSANSIAMVGVCHLDESAALLPEQPPVLIRHLEGDLNRLGTAVGVKDVIESRRSDLCKLRRQACRRDIGESQQGRVRNLIELVTDRRVDFRDTVSVNIEPQRRNTVVILIAANVNEPHPLGPLDDDRITGRPVLHLSKRMPDTALVQGSDVVV